MLRCYSVAHCARCRYVREKRQVLRRLAGQARHTSPQIFQFSTGGAKVRSRAKRTCSPKKEGAGESVADVMRLFAKGPQQNHRRCATKSLIAVAGSLPPRMLREEHGARKLDEAVPQYLPIRPRNISLRLFILLGPRSHPASCVLLAVAHRMRYRRGWGDSWPDSKTNCALPSPRPRAHVGPQTPGPPAPKPEKP